MASGSALGFWLVTSAALAGVSFASLWPLEWDFKVFAHPIRLWNHYSVGNSNVDVLLLIWLHSAVLAVLLIPGTRPKRRGFAGETLHPPYGKVRYQGLGVHRGRSSNVSVLRNPPLGAEQSTRTCSE